jgi:cupin superfamily acireductone dioxygenase involved in methionine salvage
MSHPSNNNNNEFKLNLPQLPVMIEGADVESLNRTKAGYAEKDSSQQVDFFTVATTPNDHVAYFYDKNITPTVTIKDVVNHMVHENALNAMNHTATELSSLLKRFIDEKHHSGLDEALVSLEGEGVFAKDTSKKLKR